MWQRVGDRNSKEVEAIRQVIRDHANEVLQCYEEQLQLDPKVAGKMVLRWQVNSDGSTSHIIFTPQVPDSDGLRMVGECIISRMATWEFPKPKNGGITVVTYPWVLRSSGSNAGASAATTPVLP